MDPSLVLRVGAKVLRAIEHLKSLEAAGQRYTEDHGYPGILCVGEPNSQGTKYLLRAQGNVEFPEVEWGVIIGDAVHCLRSALDQLVAGLWTERLTSRTRFPTCHTEREWIVDAPAMYWSIPPAYVAMLDRAQPYHRGDDAGNHPLAVLNVLWNLDKHRAIPAAALVPTRIKVDVIEKVGIATIDEFRARPGVAVKDGAVIAEAKITRDGSGLQPQVRVDAHLTVNIGFGTIEKASSISLKPVAETFHNVLLPAVAAVMQDSIAVHDASQ